MIDGYVVREMIRRAHTNGYQLGTIHDSFWAHPLYIEDVRKNYRDILAELADSNILQDILSEITGEDLVVTKRSYNLGDLIRKSNYALS